MFNLNNSLNILMTEIFEKQQEQSVKIENKLNDFLKNKIVFTMTSMKRRKLFDVNTKKASISIDSQFQRFASTAFFTSSSRFKSISFILFFKRVLFSFQTPFNSPSEHFLNRNVFTIIELYKKWTVELDTDFSITSLNDQHGCDWRKDWKDNER